MNEASHHPYYLKDDYHGVHGGGGEDGGNDVEFDADSDTEDDGEDDAEDDGEDEGCLMLAGA